MAKLPNDIKNVNVVMFDEIIGSTNLYDLKRRVPKVKIISEFDQNIVCNLRMGDPTLGNNAVVLNVSNSDNSRESLKLSRKMKRDIINKVIAKLFLEAYGSSEIVKKSEDNKK